MVESHQKSVSKSSLKRRLYIYLGFLISILCIWWITHAVEGEELVRQLKNVDHTFVFLALLATIASYLLRSVRWPYFFGANAPTLTASSRCVFVGFFMNNVLPARIGELVRAHLGGKATGLSRTLVLATIAAERLADGLIISLLFASLFAFGGTAAEVEQGAKMYFVAYIFFFATIFTAALLFTRHWLFSLLSKLQDKYSSRILLFTLSRIEHFVSGLEPLLAPKRLFVLSLYSISIWLIELLVYFFVAQAFHCPMSIGGLGLFLAAVNFSSLIPAAPGGIGVIEAVSTLVLVRIGIEHETALAMVATQHVIQYLVVGLPGIFLFFVTLGGRVPEPELTLEEV